MLRVSFRDWFYVSSFTMLLWSYFFLLHLCTPQWWFFKGFQLYKTHYIPPVLTISNYPRQERYLRYRMAKRDRSPYVQHWSLLCDWLCQCSGQCFVRYCAVYWGTEGFSNFVQVRVLTEWRVIVSQLSVGNSSLQSYGLRLGFMIQPLKVGNITHVLDWLTLICL